MRRTLVLLAVILAATPTLQAKSAAPASIEEVTITELQARMKTGALTARALTEAYLARIKKLDPKLRSVLEVNPDALAIAGALDAERKQKGPRGPLHGIPVLIKDNIATADRMQTTAGSLALVGVKPPRDSFVVERLRAAGAVILGKTNLSEWANMRSPHSSSGWSARGGQTNNPYALDRNPCGSSSGTGAAIAANLATVGVGTETDGSVVCPSASQALVGIKPTVGLVSRSGIIPISHNQDTAGPMARTVADAAALLTAMAAPDPADTATAASTGKATDYTSFIDPDGLRGMRIGVAPKKAFGSLPATDRVTDAAIAVLKANGAEVVDPAEIPHLGEYDDAELAVLLTDLKWDMQRYLEDWAPGAKVHTLEDLIAFDTAHASEELPFFGQEFFERAVKKGSFETPEYKKALQTCHKLAREEGLDATLTKYKLDAILAPTGGTPWLTDLVTGDHFAMSSSTPAAVSGYPAITVPAGEDHGLPLGITFMGPAWSEAKLIKIASGFEHATHARKPPRMLPSVKLTAH